MFQFAFPWVFILIPLPWIIWFFLKPKKAELSTIRTPLFSYWQNLQSKTVVKNKLLLTRLLAWLFWCLLVSSAAKPQWVGEPIELPMSGRDLFLSIDISGSMQEKDLKLNNKFVNRLEVVKSIVTEFIQRREGDRLGLVLFGDQAYLQAPLTFDLKTIQQMLNETEIGLAGEKSTAIGDGIGLAIKRLRERPEKNRVLILLTDGQNNSGELEPIEAAKLAKHAGARIYAIGIGADKAYRRSIFGTQQINPSAALDEKTLTQVAEITGGRYFRARSSQELKKIYQILDELEPIDGDPETYRPTWELYFYPAMIAFILLFLSKFLPWMFQLLTSPFFSSSLKSKTTLLKENQNAN